MGLLLQTHLNFDQFVFSAAEAQFRSSLDSMNAVSALNTLNQVAFAGIVAGIYQIYTGLINGNRIQRNQNADVLDTGIYET